jgi:hypothetical protein
LKNTTKGTGVGKGHGAQSRIPEPTFVRDESLAIGGMSIQPGTKRYKMGACSILVSPPYDDPKDGWHYGWHLTISRVDRYPSWDEIAKARYSLLDASMNMVMVLPPPEDFINIHNNCFQLHELVYGAAGGAEGSRFKV